MKKFKYRLESLLKVKEHIEKQKQKDLAAAAQKVFEQKKVLDDINDKNSTALEKKRKNHKGIISVSEMLIYSRYFMKLKRDSIAGLELLRVLSRAKEEKRKALLEASKVKKIYEKLKERELKKFNKNIEAALRKEADETGLNSYRLRKSQAK